VAALTIKQETFCQKYIETGNASEAYRQAYDAGNMKPETVNKRASELFGSGAITGRLAELRGVVQQTHGVTVASLILELEEARKVALKREQAAAMVQATMGKAKLAGLDKEGEEGGNDLSKALHDLIAKLPG
jgi:phage terminase small subunit